MFSKKLKYLYNQIKVYWIHFNFCREHMGLMKENENGISIKRTPEQESGITKGKWTLTQLLKYKCIKTSTN